MTTKERLRKLSELKLIKSILIPLMNALGASKVENFHGVKENGIDIYFAYKDIFGEIKHCGIFVKKADICKSGKNDIRKMKTQIEEALTRPFINPISSIGKIKIEEFCFACNGILNKEARQYLTDMCDSKEMPYVRIIDIDMIEQLIINIMRDYNLNNKKLYSFSINNFDKFCAEYKEKYYFNKETQNISKSEGSEFQE